MLKVLLRGYYGFGNLGDDVLMLTSYRIIKELLPKSEVVIFSNSSNNDYIRQILGVQVKIVNYSDHGNYDLIVDGGGGVFFDFNQGTSYTAFRNFLIRLIGFRVYNKLIKTYKTYRKSPQVTSNFQIGIGIGVGTFSKSSLKFSDSIRILSSYDLLLVRDLKSIENLNTLGVKLNIFRSTDLAFLHDKWNPKSTESRKEGQIGIVVRAWHDNDNESYLKWVESRALYLLEEGYSVKFFIFEKKSDSDLIERFSNRFDISVWDPHKIKLDNYLSQLASMEVLITMRAHGAILGACLGVPSVCLTIEPKLQVVAEMLTKSSSKMRLDEDEKSFLKIIKNTSKRDKFVEVDVRDNNLLMKSGVQYVQEFLKANLN